LFVLVIYYSSPVIRRHVIVVVIVHGEKSTPFLYTQNTPHTKRIYIDPYYGGTILRSCSVDYVAAFRFSPIPPVGDILISMLKNMFKY